MRGISRLTVEGFKSIASRQQIDLRPLTVFAGANSAGKSSAMQPLLLLKQTIEAAGDPGALLLDGPHVRFTSTDQLLFKCAGRKKRDSFVAGLELGSGDSVELTFEANKGTGFDVKEMRYTGTAEKFAAIPGMTRDEILGILPDRLKKLPKAFSFLGNQWEISRERCFLVFKLIHVEDPGRRSFLPAFGVSPSEMFIPFIRKIIHLPGLRGNPRRTYPKTAADAGFPGPFETYAASIIARWKQERSDKLEKLNEVLRDMGLSWKVTSQPIDDTQVELLVGRLRRSSVGGARDLVSIADVGFGVSQSLPVLVALVAAEPSQLVYLEQPEIHLHPKAQRRLAHALGTTAKRGATLVVETHSALLLREIQTMIASGEMRKDDVILHWFGRDENGCTTITSADLDDNGAWGDWPEDFDTIELEAEKEYLDTVEAKAFVR